MWLILAMAVSSACPGTTTPEVEACFAEELAADMATLARYRDAALGRIGGCAAGTDGQKARAAFLKAEKAWQDYRAAECGAVYANWSQGTIRGLMALQCNRRLAQQRTHAIWANWLTYADSSPPILPEPASERMP